MQKVQIATTSTNRQDEASEVIPNRSFLYNQEQNTMFIKYDENLKSVESKVDNKNIVLKEVDGLSCICLADDVTVKSTTVSPDNKVVVVNEFHLEDVTSPQKKIFLVVKTSDTIKEGMYGEIFRLGENITESYHISISSNPKSKNVIQGSSTNNLAKIKRFTHGDIEYYGIEFATDENADLYFHGVSNIDRLKPPLYKNYRDNTITEAAD